MAPFQRRGAERPAPSDADPHRILIVDDSPSARRLIQRVLLRIGLELPNIRVASSAHEATVLFTQWRPEVVFLDLELRPAASAETPDRPVAPPTGADLAFLFLSRNPKVKIVVCSASNPEYTPVKELVQKRSVRAVVKPLLASKLLDALGEIGMAPPARSLR